VASAGEHDDEGSDGQELPPPVAGMPASASGRPLASMLESTLGGGYRDIGGATSFVVESRRAPSSQHGGSVVGDMAGGLRDAGDELSLLAGFPFGGLPLFFDLETTGLSGGAGTYAFLVGCGWFEQDGAFATRQFMLATPSDERALLSSVAAELARAGALVSFNGKSFDGPVMEMRYLYHRVSWTGTALPHLDMLHVARRFWGHREATSADAPDAAAAREPACSLGALERTVLGHRRYGDTPGFDIPQRYFRFVRSGDPRPLVRVFEHNRLDLLSLAGLTARAAQLVRNGPDSVRDAREALALGWLYGRAGQDRRAGQSYERAMGLSKGSAAMLIESLRMLAVLERRARQYDEAAGYWRRILDVHGCPGHIAREASDALAIHHEHRVRDLRGARGFALRSLEADPRPAWEEAAKHRLNRIDRKLARSPGYTPRFAFADSPEG
jgi:hypothetical protein